MQNTTQKKDIYLRMFAGAMLIVCSFVLGWIARDYQLVSTSSYRLIVTQENGRRIVVPISNMEKLVKP